MRSNCIKAYILKSSVLLATLLAAQSVIASQVNMLFIGNSFTFRHDLPNLVKKVFEEGNPGMTLNVSTVAYGGQNMYMHSTYYFSQSFIEQSTITADSINARIKTMQGFLTLTSNPPEFQAFFDTLGKMPWISPKKVDSSEFLTRFININNAIQNHKKLLITNPKTKWDYVVLQSWQDVVPSLDQGYALGVKRLLKTIQLQGAKVILYITAPNIQNAVPVTGPQLQPKVDNDLNVARQLADSIGAYAVVPVPLAINMLQKNGTNLTFTYNNDFHPNNRTAYLTSNMFYAAFFKQSTEGFKFDSVSETKLDSNGLDPDGGPATVVFKGDEKLLLQRTAFTAVKKFDSSWNLTTSLVPAHGQGTKSIAFRRIGNNIYSMNADCGTDYRIVDITGKPVQSGTIAGENASINLSSLSKGVYLVNNVTRHKALIQKVIVQ